MSTIAISPGFSANIDQMSSGLTLIHQYIPATPVAVVDVWVQAGSRVEPNEWSGMAHFLEHMIFKGTHQLRPGMFDQAIETQGGMTNAATSHDYAHFFITTAAHQLGATLPYLAELLLHAAIPDDEFGRERDVVLEEIRQTQDNPDWLGFQALMETIYQDHPYGRSVLGTEETLLQNSPAQMRQFHSSYYQPENMVVVVAGGVEYEPTRALVEENFRDFVAPGSCSPFVYSADPPLTHIRRQEIRLPRLEQARLLMAWTGPGVDHLQDAYGLDLLAVLLGEGRSSRLVRELREERQLVQGISCDFSLQRDSSLFTISAWLEVEHLERVEAIVGDRLAALAHGLISEAELARCKRLLCNDYAFSTETPGQLAGLYGYYGTIADAALSTHYPKYIQAIQASDLQRIAQQYLSPYRYAVTILRSL